MTDLTREAIRDAFIDKVASYVLWGEKMTPAQKHAFDMEGDVFEYDGYSDDAVTWFESIVQEARKI